MLQSAGRGNNHTAELDLTDLAVAKTLAEADAASKQPSENMSRLLRRATETHADVKNERNFDAFETSKEELVVMGGNPSAAANLLMGEHDNV